jgi:hypothetical protein
MGNPQEPRKRAHESSFGGVKVETSMSMILMVGGSGLFGVLGLLVRMI